MSWLAVKLFLGSALKGLGKFLSGLTFWQIMFGAALIFAGIQTLRLKAEQRHSAKVEQQLSKAVAQLNRISSKRDEQKVITKERIRVVEKQVKAADERAKKVENAPLPGGCRTPVEIMQERGL